MGWIKSFGIGLIVFCLIFTAYFTLFSTMDSGYGYSSGFNYTDNRVLAMNNTSNYELQTSYNDSNTQAAGFRNNTQVSSASAYDNLIQGGYNAITTVWNAPVQVYNIIMSVFTNLFGIDVATYGWLYNGIFAILTLLILFAIINIIFRSNV